MNERLSTLVRKMKVLTFDFNPVDLYGATQTDAGGQGRIFPAAVEGGWGNVAMKVVGEEADESEQVRFLREAYNLCTLERHPNLVNGIAISKCGRAVMMEELSGVNLENLVKHEGPLDEYTAAGCMKGYALGLHHLHTNNKNRLIHRDAKPSNAMVTNEGILKVIDMGAVINMDEAAKSQPRQVYLSTEHVTGSARLTESGTFWGTISYSSPEHIFGQPLDARSDIFLLGLTGYYLVTGEHYFEDHPGKIIKAMKDPNPLKLPKTIPEWMRNILGKCLEKDRGDRYGSMLHLVEGLRRY